MECITKSVRLLMNSSLSIKSFISIALIAYLECLLLYLFKIVNSSSNGEERKLNKPIQQKWYKF